MNKIVTASLLLVTGITISACNVGTSTIAHHDTSSDGTDQWQQKAGATVSIITSPAASTTSTSSSGNDDSPAASSPPRAATEQASHETRDTDGSSDKDA